MEHPEVMRIKEHGANEERRITCFKFLKYFYRINSGENFRVRKIKIGDMLNNEKNRSSPYEMLYK